ncbi:hypothetical protein NKR19_g5836 [Coniochaeta hoffmannii]|uniref:Uncharacterized protein n=1 Tax=Coniochaeta hoffmannii TaxID=91930 RepID=A0AA38VUW7_9PEZI|nr:hypothetical protein NKR19_g5836 [Coniochaeta hoffmannii]
MPHPIIVIASFLTTIKTTWELSRMVRQRRAAQILKTEVPRIYRALRQAHGKGLLVGREFDYLLERLICAEASKDIIALRKIQSDFEALLARSSPQTRRRM